MLKVMILDDSPTVRKIIRRILEGMNLMVCEAVSGDEALSLCSGACPDAILVDANMAEADSYGFVRRLRRTPGGDHPRIVFCMTENQVSQTARARHAGADDILLKPFDSEMVRSKFMRLLAQ